MSHSQTIPTTGDSILPYPKNPREMSLREHIRHLNKTKEYVDKMKEGPSLHGYGSIILGRYKRLNILGEGTYGVVYKAEGLMAPHKTYYALKEIKQSRNENHGLPCTVLREIAALEEIKHPNIIELLDTIVLPNNIWLVFEYFECDLHTFLTRIHPAKESLSNPLISSIMIQLVHAIDFMHRRRYMHRDLKPQNILYDTKTGILKVADFGLARLCGIPSRKLTHEIETLWYRAPEVLMGDSTTSYGIGVDIWSIGCIFAELHTKVPFFEGVCEISQLFEIFEVCGTPTKSDWAAIDSMPHYQYDLFPKWQRLSMNFVARMEKSWQKYKIRHEPLSVTALNLLEKMLVYEPGQRSICKEMLKNVYFKDVTNPAISPTPSTDLKPNATKKIKLEEKKVFPQLVHPKLSKI